MTRQQAMKIKAHCNDNGYKITTQPGSDAFRAFKSLKKDNGSITQIKVVALLCYPSKFTVEVTVNNFRSGLNGLTDHVEVKKTVRSVEDLREMEIDIPLVESAANYFFES
mgnify:FL=1